MSAVCFAKYHQRRTKPHVEQCNGQTEVKMTKTLEDLQSCQIDAALSLNNQLCFALYSTSLAMTKSYRPLLEALGLTYSQYIVMLILWEKDGCSLKDIADKLFTESGALTPVLKRMQDMGLLIRTRSVQSERTLEIRLTDAGRALKLQAADVFLQIGKNCGLPLTDIVALREQLVALRQHLLQN
jgi:DNA-binding MarR family transcriptional regulator